MSKFILYRVFNGEVMQWQDDEQYSYGEAVDGTLRQQVTDEQYAERVDPSWYIDGVITTKAPPEPVIPPPTGEELLSIQTQKLQQTIDLAVNQKSLLNNRVGTLNDAVELEMATEEEEAELPVRVAQLKAWKTYGVLLGRVTAQAGWPSDVKWPVQPTDGM